ncbi:MAG: quinol:cytochrome C oxidoreductase [Chloroflexi bacterium]|nr:MAG: quinol:cytochrome C oxidoreductase [Chloroflexota bacterium]
MFTLHRTLTLIGLLVGLGITTACTLDMHQQPRYDPLEPSAFFADGASARPRVADTVARGQLRLDDHLYTGRIDNRFAQTFPFTVTLQTLERGRERYNIFCAPCHGLVGDGDSIMTEYGMRTPNSFHDPDVAGQPPGYYFAIISNGTRIMPSYAARISPEDRWAIVAYIRALQMSQNIDVSQLSPEDLAVLEESGN